MQQRDKIISGVVVACAVGIIGGACLLKATMGSKLDIKPEVHIEVGEPVILEPSLFANDTMSEADINRMNISTKLTKEDNLYTYNVGDKSVVSKNKKYLDKGIYEVTVKSGTKEARSKLIVEDTTGPVITEKGTDHRTPVGTTAFDYTSMVDIFDYSEFDVDIDSRGVDLNLEGTYSVLYTAKDEFGNMSTKKVTLNVGEENQPIIIDPDGNKQEPVKNYDDDDDYNNYYTNNDDDDDDDYNNYYTNNDDEDDNDDDDKYHSEEDNKINWRDKYKRDKLYKADSSKEDNESDSKDKGDFGTVKTKTFNSTKEADAWISKNLMGKGTVRWTIENKGNKVKYDFTYD